MNVAYVYVIGPDRDGNHKIGMSANVRGRLSTIQAVFHHSPGMTASYWGAFPRLTALEIESVAHQMAAEHQVAREWFFLDREAASEIVFRAMDHLGIGKRETLRVE